MRALLGGLSRLRKRPRLLVGALAVLVAAGVGGPHVWAWIHFSAGRSALAPRPRAHASAPFTVTILPARPDHPEAIAPSWFTRN